MNMKSNEEHHYDDTEENFVPCVLECGRSRRNLTIATNRENVMGVQQVNIYIYIYIYIYPIYSSITRLVCFVQIIG